MKKNSWAIIAFFSVLPIALKAQYLPLTAGSSYPITGLLITNVYNTNQIALNNNGTNYGFIINPSPAKWSLGYGTTLTSTGTSVLTWNDSGNVGIGTTSPSTTLDVNGQMLIEGTNSLNLGNTSHQITNNSGIAIQQNTAGEDITVNNVQNNGILFKTLNTERLRIDGSGNVSIGTVDPKGYKLAVDGDVIATAVTVKLYAAWPDYVFRKAYKLPSLSSVKSYIDQNQHLPEMPSAQEVEKNGLNLGEMNKLLLKKVEELTLYLIEKDKQVSEQQSQIDELKKQLKLIANKLN